MINVNTLYLYNHFINLKEIKFKSKIKDITHKVIKLNFYKIRVNSVLVKYENMNRI